MRTGVLPSNIYDRAVYKPIHKYNKDRGTVCEAACASLHTGDYLPPVTAYAELSEVDSDDGHTAGEQMRICFGRLFGYAIGASRTLPGNIGADIVIPAYFSETNLKQIISLFIICCGEWDVGITELKVRASDNTKCAQMFASAVYSGSRTDQKISTDPPASDRIIYNRDIVMVGLAGASGTRLASYIYEDRLNDRYTPEYITRMKKAPVMTLAEYKSIYTLLSEKPEYICNAAGIYSAGEGGIYAALWEMGKQSGCGFCVYLKSIPVCQETVELCNYLDMNPYALESAGCMLILTPDADALVRELTDNNILSAHIGCLTSSVSRVIINGEEESFLNMPAMDEIYRTTD